ncbi:MAG: HD-GYP domain-containing protein [Anaerovoracaceae bacterium]
MDSNNMDNNNIADSLGRRQSRADSVIKLVPIEAGYFYPGLYVDFSIYIKMGKSTTLLCSDVTLNEALIEKIDAAEDGGHLICVTRDSYKKIIMNAATVAEANGSKIDWDGVKKAADNPQTVDEFVSEAQKPAEIEGLPKGAIAGRRNRHKRETIRRQALEEAELSAVEFVSENEENQLMEARIRKIHEYLGLGQDVEKLLSSSLRNYTVRIAEVNELAEKLVALVRTTEPELLFQGFATIRSEEHYLKTHALNVACLNVLIGQWMGLPHSERINLAIVGLLQDLGKQQIANKILNKSDRLTNDEYKIMQRHSIHSYNIAVSSGFTSQSILSGIRHHHERLNGTGYPDRISGDAISMTARISAVSDIYDAMVSRHSYRNNYSPLDTMAEFVELANVELDPKVVNTVVENMALLFSNKEVLLSNGQTGIIKSLNSSDYAHPIVQVGKEYIKTTKFLKVVSIADIVPLKHLSV